jgi:hypothetical protein
MFLIVAEVWSLPGALRNNSLTSSSTKISFLGVNDPPEAFFAP